jgi:predicted Fe-Mo cluster-binding NifX family protein
MKIAIPIENGKMCVHFGHAEQFAVLTVNKEKALVEKNELLTPPPHEPGVLPQWLHQMGVQTVIAGGMGGRAQQLLTQHGIEIKNGIPNASVDELVSAFLKETLANGTSGCDHSGCHH